MNLQPVDQQSQQISDDQELAKVLAGVGTDDASSADDTVATLPEPTAPPVSDDQPPVEEPVSDPVLPPEPPVVPEPMPAPTTDDGSVDPALDSIKQQALGELRPLVDKLNVNPEEKFDTYLLLLRSTDDKALISPAYEAARAIPDEARKAQALLDVIKEIDFLSQGQ